MRQVIVGDNNKKIALSIADDACSSFSEEILASYLPKIALYFYNKYFGNQSLDIDDFNTEECKHIQIKKLVILPASKIVSITCAFYTNTHPPEGWKFLLDLADREKLIDFPFLEYRVYEKIEIPLPKFIPPKVIVMPLKIKYHFDAPPPCKVVTKNINPATKPATSKNEDLLLAKSIQGAISGLIISTIIASIFSAILFSGGAAIPLLLAATVAATLSTNTIIAIAICSVIGATTLGAGIGLLVGYLKKRNQPEENKTPEAQDTAAISEREEPNITAIVTENPLSSEPAALVGPPKSTFKFFDAEPQSSQTLEQFKREVLTHYEKKAAINIYAGSHNNAKFNESCKAAFRNDLKRKDGKFAQAVINVLNDPNFKNFDINLLQEVPVIFDWLNRSGTCIKLK